MATFAFEELTPTAFLRRSAEVHGDRTAVVDGELRLSYRDFLRRSLAVTGLLAARGVDPGDRVAALCARLVAYLRESPAGYKVARRVHFTDLPKTATGKIRKSVLRADGAGR